MSNEKGIKFKIGERKDVADSMSTPHTLKKTNVGSMCILHMGSTHKQIIYFMLCVNYH